MHFVRTDWYPVFQKRLEVRETVTCETARPSTMKAPGISFERCSYEYFRVPQQAHWRLCFVYSELYPDSRPTDQQLCPAKIAGRGALARAAHPAQSLICARRGYRRTGDAVHPAPGMRAGLSQR